MSRARGFTDVSMKEVKSECFNRVTKSASGSQRSSYESFWMNAPESNLKLSYIVLHN